MASCPWVVRQPSWCQEVVFAQPQFASTLLLSLMAFGTGVVFRSMRQDRPRRHTGTSANGYIPWAAAEGSGPPAGFGIRLRHPRRISRVKPVTGTRPVKRAWGMMIMRWRTWIVVFALCTAPGCSTIIRSLATPSIRGSGVAKEETRSVEAFHALQAGNALQVTVAVTPGAKASIKISGDDDLVRSLRPRSATAR